MMNREAGSRQIETGQFFPIMACVVRLVLAGIFVYSGSVKLVDPSRFAEVIAGFGLLPGPAGAFERKPTVLKLNSLF